MALKKSFADRFGNTYPNAYWRIAKFTEITKETVGFYIQYIVTVYPCKEVRESNPSLELAAFTWECRTGDAPANVYSEMYGFMKNFPELEGAEDC